MQRDPVQISRDPFARTTLVRRTVDCLVGCWWCGSHNRRRPDTLFEYGTERDGISASYVGPHWHKGLFCSKSCHDSYNS